jgi:hypothetical protein
MGGVVKTVAKVAVPAAIAYAGYQTGGFGMSPGQFSIHKGIGGIPMGGGGSFLGGIGSAITKNPFTAASLAMQGYSGIQAQKYASQQSGYQRQQIEAKNKSDAARNRYNQLLQKRSRYQAIRAARIAQAQVGGGYGSAVGAGGTSGYVGSVGSLGTQISENIGNINVAEDVGNQITQFNTMSANYGTQAAQAGAKGTGWKDTFVLGDSIFNNAEKIFG